jgi:CRP/FNR family transcriptional regulator, cyclic AMP receptor protein
MAQIADVIAHLRQVDLFQNCEEAALARVAAAANERRFSPGQTIFLRGDDADLAIFIVRSGRVRLSVNTVEGRELTIRHVGAGAVFGEISLIDDGPRTADATAMTSCALLTVSRAQFQKILVDDAAFANALLRGLCARLRDTTEQLEAVALMPLEQRLARIFLHLAIASNADARRVTIKFEMSQGELANLVAASRPKVNQILVAWDSAAVASRTPQGLLVDIQALQDIADGRDNA